MSYQEELWHDERPDGSFAYLINRGLTPATIWEAKLGYVPRNEKTLPWVFHDSIQIPYFDAQGEPRGSRYRLLSHDATHKYHSVYASRHHLYNVKDTWASTVYITEGEFDCLILKQMGYMACGVAGVKAWRADWKHLFRSCDEVVVVMDADEAGGGGSNRIMANLGGLVPKVRRAELPDGFDVTELYMKDPDELRRRL